MLDILAEKFVKTVTSFLMKKQWNGDYPEAGHEHSHAHTGKRCVERSYNYLASNDSPHASLVLKSLLRFWSKHIQAHSKWCWNLLKCRETFARSCAMNVWGYKHFLEFLPNSFTQEMFRRRFRRKLRKSTLVAQPGDFDGFLLLNGSLIHTVNAASSNSQLTLS